MLINAHRLAKRLSPQFALALQDDDRNDVKLVSKMPVNGLYHQLWISGSLGTGHWVTAHCVLAVFQAPQVAWRGLFVDKCIEFLNTSEAVGATEIRTPRQAENWENTLVSILPGELERLSFRSRSDLLEATAVSRSETASLLRHAALEKGLPAEHSRRMDEMPTSYRRFMNDLTAPLLGSGFDPMVLELSAMLMLLAGQNLEHCTEPAVWVRKLSTRWQMCLLTDALVRRYP
jgi:hypothetical protein